jgi:Uma2 family endonuclease
MTGNMCPDCDKPLAFSATECACGWHQNLTPITGPGKTLAEIYAEVDAKALESSRRFLRENGLERKPDESIDDWRKRTLEFLQAKGGIKKFGRAA